MGHAVYSGMKGNDKMELNNFVRRSGHWHKYEQNESTALCGMALISSNYEDFIPEDNRTPCGDCMDTMGFSYSLDEIHEAFNLN